MSDIVSQVQQFYDEAGVHFSRTRQKTYGSGTSNWVVTDKYLKLLKPGQSVLDVGCGNGKLVSGLPAGIDYTGTDFSQTLLSEARTLHPDHDFRYGNILDDAHWDSLGMYDAIFCVAVLHHIPSTVQQVNVLKQMKRHLAKDGSLFLTVWNLNQPKFEQYRVGDHYEVPYNHEWKRYCVAFDESSLAGLAQNAHLIISEIFYTEDRQNLVMIAKV